MDKEIWCDVKGYEGLYQVSNLGRVKSLARVNSLGRRVNEKILRPQKNGLGYLFVYVCKGGSRKMYTVHRLVLMTFSPVENMNELQVNHIDEDKTNNHLSNLEWITHKDNQNHGTRNKRISEKNSIPVTQLSLDGKYIRSYKSSYDAARGGYNQGNIINCCKGKLKTHGGFRWMYLSSFMDKHNGIID